MDQQCEAEKPETIGLLSEVTGVSVNPEGESRHRQEGKRESNKNGKKCKWEGTLGRGCGGSKSEKKSDLVESEETQENHWT